MIVKRYTQPAPGSIIDLDTIWILDTRDSDGDGIPDSFYGAVCNETNVNCDDNCIYVSNNDQIDDSNWEGVCW